MNRLELDSLINPGEDSEIIKYKILGFLKEYLSNIRRNKLYPTLTELVSLSVKLENMITQTVGHPNIGEDFSITGNLDSGEGYNDESSELIKWTRAQLYPILDEGIAVYEFVDENIDIYIINGASLYKDNGYVIIPEYNANQFNIYSYHCILFNTSSSPIKSVKTLFQQSIPMNSSKSINDQFYSLIDAIGDKNLPVYYCDTELDFPYEETIYQIARKKLLKILSM